MPLQIQELKKSNEFLNILINSITSAVFLVDKEIRIQNVNNSFYTLFQSSEACTIGERCGNAIGCVYPKEEKKECGKTSHCNKCELRESLLKSFTEQIPTYRKKLAREFYIDEIKKIKYLQFSNLYINYNNEEMILIVVDDITELEIQKLTLEKQNEELKALDKQKDEFLGMAAHDLRSPVGVIQMYTEYLIEALENQINQDEKKILNTIHKSSEFILNLMNDLLDLTKIKSGSLNLDLKQQDYVETVLKNIELNKILAAKKNITISLHHSQKIPLLFFDQNKIQQVLNNLISNAIKYSYNNTEITIDVYCDGDSILTKISDQGQGIPSFDLSKIFEPFHKSSVKATAGEKSTGLGLAIVKKIIEGHKGKVEVISEVGKGTTFIFTLPLGIKI
ncbi:MAG: HAMP domain-containing histidine kinase [Candidatus Brocadiae bacterium]|nr:HAMP domain-containing histidine kinase [Candidatus Brocadiia bacterium]